jgi:cystathionine gamma-synthase
MSESWSAETLLAQALGEVEAEFGGVVPPIHVATTYLRASDNTYPLGVAYGRDDNPTVRAPERVLEKIENGEEALLFASGMAAATAVFEALPFGAHIVAPRVMYWGLRKWLEGRAKIGRFRTDFVDLHQPGQLEMVLRQGETAIVWIETPSNPMWRVTDIKMLADTVHLAGALLAVDSTAATPLLTRPLDLGADVVMHSATKYLNGHSDVLAGALVFKKADDFFLSIKNYRHDVGPILGQFEAWLLLRGMRTLHLRVAESCKNAMAIAERFAEDHRLTEVLYPGLSTHPEHDLAREQMGGKFGGMLSIRVHGGEKNAISVASRVKVWKRATSLGGVESLIEHRASIEGPSTPVPVDLLRLSVGVENCSDLILDIDQALKAVLVS